LLMMMMIHPGPLSLGRSKKHARLVSVFVSAVVFLLKRAREDYGFSEHTEVSPKEGPALGGFDPCVLPAGRLAGAVELWQFSLCSSMQLALTCKNRSKTVAC